MSVLTNAEKIVRLEITVNKIVDYVDRKINQDYWGLKSEINDALKAANLLRQEGEY